MRPVTKSANCGLCRAGVLYPGVLRHISARPDAWILRDSKLFVSSHVKPSEILRWSAESRLSAAVGTSEPASATPQVSFLMLHCEL